MLYYRKYLHVELIGPRVCSSAETAITRYYDFLKPRRNREIAVSSVAILQLQKYKRDYTERYSESVSNANETRKKYTRLRAKEENREMISQCVTRIQANAQGTQYAEWIMPPQSQISLYCPNSAAEAAAISSSELYSKLSCPGVPSHLYPDAYIPTRIFAYVPVHVHIRRPTSESWMNRLKKRAGIARAAIITSRSFILGGIEMHGGLHKRIPRYRTTRFAIETQ